MAKIRSPLTLVATPSRAPLSDADLVRQIRGGDAQAFEVLFRDRYEPLVRYAHTFLDSVEGARDIVCEVFAAVWQQRMAWEPAGGVQAYLFCAVRNRCMNVIRDDRRHDELWERRHPDELPLPRAASITVDDELERSARWAAVREAIEEMRGLRREAMRLRWIEQMGHAEIALVMGISVNAVQQHLSLALKSLRARFTREAL
jgi:RNA polymerase sigma-70 factor (ECF subfamily)